MTGDNKAEQVADFQFPSNIPKLSAATIYPSLKLFYNFDLLSFAHHLQQQFCQEFHPNLPPGSRPNLVIAAIA